MHILIIPSWYPTNEKDLNGNFFREQAQALAAAGHKVGVIAPMYRSLRLGQAALRPDFESTVWHDGPVTVLRSHGVFTASWVPHFDLCRWCRTGERLFGQYVANHGRPEVIHAHSLLLGGVLAERISKRFDIPFGVTEHSSTFARGLVHNWQLRGLKRATQNASFRLSVSQALANSIESTIKIGGWTIIPNSLSPLFEEKIFPLHKKNSDQIKLVSIGNLNQNKGFHLLLSAIAKVRTRGASVTLSIVGDGPKRSALIEQAHILGLSNTVRFLGSLSREGVRNILRESDAFILASNHETFGIVYIEALSQGLPVIATRSGGPESIITNRDGLLIPTGNVTALADAIITLINKLSDFNKSEIRSAALARFSQSSLVSQLENIYTCAITQSKQ